MKTIFAYLVFLLFSYVAIWGYYNCNWCGDKIKEEVSKQTSPVTITDTITPIAKKLSDKLIILDHNADTLFIYSNRIKVISKTDSIIFPSDFNTVITDMKSYLNTHPTTTIQISSNLEDNESINDSVLRGKRGMLMKEYLMNQQINKHRVYIDSTSKNQNQGLDIRFIEMDSVNLMRYENSLNSKLLYANFNEHSFKPDIELIAYTRELKSYIERYPTKNITVTGHTDAIGNEKDNVWFGKERARNVKNYLISQGIPGEKIEIESKGETTPIAPNDTEVNKAKNRRIEIIIN